MKTFLAYRWACRQQYVQGGSKRADIIIIIITIKRNVSPLGLRKCCCVLQCRIVSICLDLSLSHWKSICFTGIRLRNPQQGLSVKGFAKRAAASMPVPMCETAVWMPSLWAHTSVCVCMRIHMHTCVCVSMCMCIHTYLCVSSPACVLLNSVSVEFCSVIWNRLYSAERAVSSPGQWTGSGHTVC